MSCSKRFPGGAPPRAPAAAAAFVVTLVLQGAVLGLFHGRSSEVRLLAAPALERQLEACRAHAGLAAQLTCSRALVVRAREGDEPVRLAAR